MYTPSTGCQTFALVLVRREGGSVTHCLFHSINYVVRAKWQHAQRVVPQKMATGGDENKKNNNSNTKKKKRARRLPSMEFRLAAFLRIYLSGCQLHVCAVCVSACAGVCVRFAIFNKTVCAFWATFFCCCRLRFSFV